MDFFTQLLGRSVEGISQPLSRRERRARYHRDGVRDAVAKALRPTSQRWPSQISRQDQMAKYRFCEEAIAELYEGCWSSTISEKPQGVKRRPDSISSIQTLRDNRKKHGEAQRIEKGQWNQLLDMAHATISRGLHTRNGALLNAMSFTLHMSTDTIMNTRLYILEDPIRAAVRKYHGGGSPAVLLESMPFPLAESPREIEAQLTVAFQVSLLFYTLWNYPPLALVSVEFDGIYSDISPFTPLPKLQHPGGIFELVSAMKKLETTAMQAQQITCFWQKIFVDRVGRLNPVRTPNIHLVQQFVNGIVGIAATPGFRQISACEPTPLQAHVLNLIRVCLNSVRIMYSFFTHSWHENLATCGCLHETWTDHRRWEKDLRQLITQLLMAAAPDLDAPRRANHRHHCTYWQCGKTATSFLACNQCLDQKLKIICYYCSPQCLKEDQATHELFHRIFDLVMGLDLWEMFEERYDWNEEHRTQALPPSSL